MSGLSCFGKVLCAQNAVRSDERQKGDLSQAIGSGNDPAEDGRLPSPIAAKPLWAALNTAKAAWWPIISCPNVPGCQLMNSFAGLANGFNGESSGTPKTKGRVWCPSGFSPTGQSPTPLPWQLLEPDRCLLDLGAAALK